MEKRFSLIKTNQKKHCMLLLLSVTLITCACQKETPQSLPLLSSSEPTRTASEAFVQSPIPTLPNADAYIQQLAMEFAKNHMTASMNEVEKIEALYCALVGEIFFAEPPDQDYWIYRANPKKPPSYLYHRAMGPLAYGIGSCEDFAAALTLVLRCAGFEAEYVSGLTVSAQREWVDHAWTVVRLSENWYHLDSQLEQNVMKNKKLTYRYFLRDDTWMLADHLWGNWLASYWQGKQTPIQREQLLKDMTPPLCQGPSVSHPHEKALDTQVPLLSETLQRLHIERESYLRTHGTIPEGMGQWEPPIFRVMPKK